MKLLSLTSIYLAGLSLVIFILMGGALYLTLRTVSNKEIDTLLKQEQSQVIANPELFMVASMGNIPFYERLSTRNIDSIPDPSYFFFDSTYVDSISNQKILARYLRFYMTVQEDPVEFTLHQKKLSSTELLKRISIATTLLSAMFIFLLFFLNRFVFIRLWSSFFDTLRAIRSYGPEQKPLKLPDSGIIEFHTLNQTISMMTDRISEMYRNLQDFTAHTTHEIQTPLAVIRSKTELLLQTQGLTPEQLELIGSIEDNSRHLSQLNRSLALLFKIGNHRMPEAGSFEASGMIEDQIENLEELIEKLDLRIEKNIQSPLIMPMDHAMGAILIQNLIKNSVVHNIQGGTIRITLKPGFLEVSNSGKKPDYPTEYYFTEFVKGPDSKGLGLGLSLIKKIGQVTGFSVEYGFREDFHTFRVTWNEKK
jgi:signal transduction histidine kinase